MFIAASFYAQSPIEYRTYSDRSLKRNVEPLKDALATIEKLEGVSYELVNHPFDNNNRVLSEEEEYDRQHQIGFIAQDVEPILPQLVREDDTSGLKTVSYVALIPVLVEAIKEQQKQIDGQQEMLEAQRGEIDELRRRLD